MKNFKKTQGKAKKPVVEVPEASSDEEEVEAESGEEVEDDDDSEEEVEGAEVEDDSDEEEDDEEEDDDEQEIDVNESSSEDDDDDIEEDETAETAATAATKKIPFDTPKVEVKNDLLGKYHELQGKRLFVRFPYKLPEEGKLDTVVKEMCSLVTKVIRPRQNHARFCIVQFDSQEDREKALAILKAVKLEDNKKLHIEYPRHENKEFLDKIMQLKEQKKEEKKAKLKLRRQAKKKIAQQTPTLIISNIPKTANIADIKELFPTAVDIKLKRGKNQQDTGIATVTLSSPHEASTNKSRKLTLEENKLSIKFALPKNANKKIANQKNGKTDKPESEKKTNKPSNNSKKNKGKGKPGKNQKPAGNKQNANNSPKPTGAKPAAPKTGDVQKPAGPKPNAQKQGNKNKPQKPGNKPPQNKKRVGPQVQNGKAKKSKN